MTIIRMGLLFIGAVGTFLTNVEFFTNGENFTLYAIESIICLIAFLFIEHTGEEN